MLILLMLSSKSGMIWLDKESKMQKEYDKSYSKNQYSVISNGLCCMMPYPTTDEIKPNTAYPIYETKRIGSHDWARIGENRWICLDYCVHI